MKMEQYEISKDCLELTIFNSIAPVKMMIDGVNNRMHAAEKSNDSSA